MTQHSRRSNAAGIAALVLLAMAALPATPVQAQDTTVKVALKQLAPAEAKSTRSISTVSSLRGLPDGSVFIHDNQRRQVLRFDASLKNASVLADTAAGSAIPYGQRQMGMLPYLGDSTILVDPSTNAMLVLNREGKLVRIMAPPRNNDVNSLAGMNLGSNAFDSKGQLVYRQGNAGGGPNLAQMFGSGGGGDRGGRGGGTAPSGQPAQQRQGAQAGGGDRGGDRGGGGGFSGGPGGGRGGQGQSSPDSIPVVRVNFDTRKADSVAWIKVPKTETSMTRSDDGVTRITSKINPLPQGDDWVLLSDGTIAVVRVLDYHVDWFDVDGKRTSSERLPFDWKRISDDEKTKMVDSLNVLAKQASERMAAGGNSNFRMSFEVTAPEKLPDYYPPVRAGSSMADHDGNLWILPTTSNLQAQLAAQQAAGGGRGGFGGGPPGGGRGGAGGGPPSGGPPVAGDSTRSRAAGDSTARAAMAAFTMPLSPPAVYDVVNRKGELMYRVQVPAGRQLIGFGANGVVYLSSREGRDLFVEKTRVLP